MSLRKSALGSTILVCFLAMLVVSASFGQESKVIDKGIEATANEVAAVLDKVDGLFYKKEKNANGDPFFTLVWERDGEISKINLFLMSIGYSDNQTIYMITATTVVAESDKAFPPAIVKMVANESINVTVGGYAMPDKFNRVVTFTNVYADTLTTGQVWLTCAYLHKNRIRAKKEIDLLRAEATK